MQKKGPQKNLARLKIQFCSYLQYSNQNRRMPERTHVLNMFCMRYVYVMKKVSIPGFD